LARFLPRGSASLQEPRTEDAMILEDLEHRYDGLKQRIALVRSYL